MTKAWWDERDPKPLQPYEAVRGVVDKALKAGWAPDRVLDALRVAGNDPPVVGWRLEKALIAGNRQASTPDYDAMSRGTR